MAFYTVDGDDLSAIADKIRAKKNISTPLEFPDGFVNGVNSIYAELDYTMSTKRITLNSGITIEPGKFIDLASIDSTAYIASNIKCSPILNYTIGATVSPAAYKSKLVVFFVYAANDSRYHIYLGNTHTSTISITGSGFLNCTFRVYKANLF